MTAAADTTKTLTRADLTESLFANIGLSRTESADLVEAAMEEMCQGIMEEGELKVSGFGTFQVRSKTERVGRNPKTGIEVPIAPRKVLVFKASQILKERVNKGE